MGTHSNRMMKLLVDSGISNTAVLERLNQELRPSFDLGFRVYGLGFGAQKWRFTKTREPLV